MPEQTPPGAGTVVHGGRRSTGLVRGWAVRDGAVYAALSTNVVTLGMVEFAAAPAIPRGQLLTSVLVSGVWVSFLAVTYAGLIVTMPRAGGDYVWQSRLVNGPFGFVISVTGLWFILWLWAPIYGTILSEELFQPAAADLGAAGAARWFASPNGRFAVCMLTIVLAAGVVWLGMSAYARVQLWCFGGGLAGLAVMFVVMAVSTKAEFRTSADLYGQALFGTHGSYRAAEAAGAGTSFGLGPLGPSMRLVPMMMFYLLWPNTGSPLYGEVKGAGDFRRVLTGMLSGLWATVVLSVVFLVLADRTFGWPFYRGADAAWSDGHGLYGIFPYPAMLAGWLVHDRVFQVALVVVMSLWFFGWVGTLFLGSTRVIFAAAFDRVLPDAVAHVSPRRHVPTVALALMLVPAAGVSVLYAYWPQFGTFTLDAVLVIAVTYLVSSVLAVALPWRDRQLWRASPASRVRVLGVPLVPLSGLVTTGLIGFCLYEWLSDPVYGVNGGASLLFMGCLYLLAAAVYAVGRRWRGRRGVDLRANFSRVPDE